MTEISVFDSDLIHEDDGLNLRNTTATGVTPEYQEALQSDVVGLVRRFITACRASGQRREEFEKIIVEGNTDSGWLVRECDENGEWVERMIKLRVVGLLKDVDTRWSSTFGMIHRFLELYPVSLQVSVVMTISN